MTRRGLLATLASLASPLFGAQRAEAASAATDPQWQLSDAEWKQDRKSTRLNSSHRT